MQYIEGVFIVAGHTGKEARKAQELDFNQHHQYSCSVKECRLCFEGVIDAFFTEDPGKALGMYEEADKDGKHYLQLLLERAHRSRSITPRKPKQHLYLSYMPFQQAGIEYCLETNATLIADAMGLGKTVEVAGIINQTNPKKTLVVCPATVKVNWGIELIKWLAPKKTISTVGSSWKDAEVVIINYDRVAKYKNKILGTKKKPVHWDLCVLDESHYLKNPKAVRTKTLVGNRGVKATRRLALTGTPLNKPADLYPVLNWLDPNNWGNRWYYLLRYCNAYQGNFGWVTDGSSNEQELNRRLRSTIMLRRTKEEALTQLPKKTRQVVELEVPRGKGKLLQKEWELFSRDEVQGDNQYVDELEKYAQRLTVPFEEMATVRRELAIEKGEIAKKFIVDLLDATDDDYNVLVFGHHKEVLKDLHSTIPNSALIIGGQTDKQRSRAVDRIQKNNKPGGARVGVISTRAGGIGLTLIAKHVLFVEQDWNPDIITQAEDRAHRIGQGNKLLVQHLVLAGSLDSHMIKLIIKKQRTAQAVLA